jgi:hypothetical protein
MTRIIYADGRRVECETVEEAVARLGRECDVIEECGDRWLAWATEADADGDDGARAVAEVRT